MSHSLTLYRLDTLQLLRKLLWCTVTNRPLHLGWEISSCAIGVGVGTSLIWAVHHADSLSSESGYVRLTRRVRL